MEVFIVLGVLFAFWVSRGRNYGPFDDDPPCRGGGSCGACRRCYADRSCCRY